MKKKTEVYISLGSNLGDRLQNLEQAVRNIKNRGISIIKTSSVYETPALLPPTAPENWNKPFLNTVIKIQFEQPPIQLLHILKNIEKTLGREKTFKWAPRVIDLDILLFGEEIINTPHLKIPHPELTKRNFVLTPLKEVNPYLKIPGTNRTTLDYFRKLKVKTPTLMHIFNITPDSFSDGDQLNIDSFQSALKKMLDHNVHIVDLGAESTRPGATPVSPNKEWQRLAPYIEVFFDFYKDKCFRPRLSIDTRHPQTVLKALDKGADIINDVSGLSHEMKKCIKDTNIEYILMHSLTVPANPKKTLSVNTDPVEEIKKWLNKKLDILNKHNIHLNRIIFDPGIGFGKTAEQSLEILKRIEEFYSFPFRILVGHSRKSFMKIFSYDKPQERDPESAGISLFLAAKGVDILRVHKAGFHNCVLRGFLNCSNME